MLYTDRIKNLMSAFPELTRVWIKTGDPQNAAAERLDQRLRFPQLGRGTWLELRGRSRRCLGRSLVADGVRAAASIQLQANRPKTASSA